MKVAASVLRSLCLFENICIEVQMGPPSNWQISDGLYRDQSREIFVHKSCLGVLVQFGHIVRLESESPGVLLRVGSDSAISSYPHESFWAWC